jgi:hypothetical protein
MKIIHKSKSTVTIYFLTEYSIKSCLSCKSSLDCKEGHMKKIVCLRRRLCQGQKNIDFSR